MNPMALAMTGFGFGLWLNGCYLLGNSRPAKGTKSSPAKTVGIVGSLPAALTMTFASIWFIVGTPFGGREAWELHALFSSITGLYGLLWIGMFAVQVFDFDWQPIAHLCLLAALIQAIEIFAAFHILGTTGIHIRITNGVLASYVVWLLLFAGMLYGKISARIVGWWSIVAVIGTLYLLFVGGGIFRHP